MGYRADAEKMTMKKWNYYNEIDPLCCAWIKELITAGLVPDGAIDNRSITEVSPDEIKDFAQCHFFGGILGWPLALRLAGWPADSLCWTGSAPCQPFSVAGKQQGTSDERHLWPIFFELIRACRPPIIFGEQVANSDVLGSSGKQTKGKAGSVWFDGICADLEEAHYTVGACDLPAAGISAPHIRQRLYWVAYTDQHGRRSRSHPESEPTRRTMQSHDGSDAHRMEIAGREPSGRMLSRPGESDRKNSSRSPDFIGGPSSSCLSMADTEQQGLEGHDGNVNHRNQPGRSNQEPTGSATEASCHGGTGNPESDERRDGEPREIDGREVEAGRSSAWSNSILIPCRDGKYRRIPQSGIFPLVAKFSSKLVQSGNLSIPEDAEANATGEARVMRLKGYGNAIVPELAAEFIMATLEAL